MPGCNGTGPEGKGARTGRQLGRCNPENETEIKDTPRKKRRGIGLKLRLRDQASTSTKGKVFKRKW